MDRLIKMLRSFFWLAILPPVIMLMFIIYFYGSAHIFGFAVFVLVCIASTCANTYRIGKEIRRTIAKYEQSKLREMDLR